MFYFLHCTYSTELCLYVLCISFLNCFLLFILFGIVFLMGSFFGFPHDVVFLKTFYLTLHSFFHTLLDSRSFLFLQYCTVLLTLLFFLHYYWHSALFLRSYRLSALFLQYSITHSLSPFIFTYLTLCSSFSIVLRHFIPVLSSLLHVYSTVLYMYEYPTVFFSLYIYYFLTAFVADSLFLLLFLDSLLQFFFFTFPDSLEPVFQQFP